VGPRRWYNRGVDLVTLDPQSAVAPFEQVRAQLAEAIECGMLRAGTRLPTVRSLASDLGLAVNTVARAYRELDLQGLVSTNGRHGTFVAADSPAARQQADVEAGAFVARMRALGIAAPEMVAIVRRQAERHPRRDGDRSGGGVA
jgi:DNA-binding transcriptional regulator YhcF (GntR family)